MTHRPFPPVPRGYPFPDLELQVLEEWRQREVFRKSLERPAPRGEWVFYEGPPTANNAPHVGHVVTRVVKDLFPRYRTMRGYRVPRKAGWDTHGLPVEIEVEKRLGFAGKQQIEAYGIAEFNRECLESVHTYERQWRAMTERVGYWIDLDAPYLTYSNEYIESLWWALARLAEQGLLVKGYKIQPYCARCGTTLSSHEVAQNYRDVDDPSVWVRFPVRQGQEIETVDGARWATPPGFSLLAWTTTPWTLLAHVGLVVHPELTYRVVADPAREGELLLFAEGLEVPVPVEVAGEEGRRRLDLRELPTVARFRGQGLHGLRYDRPFPTGEPDREGEGGPFSPPPSDQDGWRVVIGAYVTASEGTGLVHTAPPFGEDDYQTGTRFGFPFFLTVDGEGRVRDKPGIEPFAGQWFKEADPAIVRDLRERGLLLHGDRYRHSYPFCWRCDTPLLYYASTSWFVTTTGKRDELLAANREIDWHPAHVGEGRFGNWLENVVDWALSRRRYWGTPLPIWECSSCEAREVIGSFAELFARAGIEPPADPYDRALFDPHRPAIDAIEWPCATCDGGTMTRVEEVADAWFDSGAMPFAQHHYLGQALPHFDPEREAGFPADLIAEAVDQTRGWFYTLHVLGVLLFGSPAYRHCVVLGHVNDEQGRKMSKRLGNVVEPMAVIDETGADALRWYFCAGNPEQSSRFSAALVREAAQRFMLPLWNALSFFTIYANLDRWSPDAERAPFGERPALDRWILLRLDQTVAEVTAALEGYRVGDGPKALEALVEDLTNWYIRRSRDRFWAGAADAADKENAYQTLYEVLSTLCRLLAPFVPFLAETLHRHLVRSQEPGAAESVHLEDWPAPAARQDEALLAGMAAVQRIVRLGHAARSSHGLKTRQPLGGVTLVTADPGLPELVAPHQTLLEEELNVKAIHWAAERSAYVRHQVRPVFPRTGPRFGKDMPKVKRALEGADGDALTAELEARGRITLGLDGVAVELSAEEVEVRLEEREGIATQGDRELLVALDTAITPELAAEGLAREVVHRIQSARKQADLDYADRIRVRYRAEPELAAAVEAHRDWIAGETLAVELAAAAGDEPLEEAPVEGRSFAFALERIGEESPEPGGSPVAQPSITD
jgi:isoleucyl-tRNA synthetase